MTCVCVCGLLNETVAVDSSNRHSSFIDNVLVLVFHFVLPGLRYVLVLNHG